MWNEFASHEEKQIYDLIGVPLKDKNKNLVRLICEFYEGRGVIETRHLRPDDDPKDTTLEELGIILKSRCEEPEKLFYEKDVV